MANKKFLSGGKKVLEGSGVFSTIAMGVFTNELSAMEFWGIKISWVFMFLGLMIGGMMFIEKTGPVGQKWKEVHQKLIRSRGSMQYLRYLILIWCALSTLFIIVSFVHRYVMLKWFETAEYSVYYENYVLKYGLPMGTGRSTNECVGGWYKFEFKGTHKFTDEALCLYGENRRYRFLCFNRYRTLRRVTQVNSLNKEGRPLWFSQDGDVDGPTSIMEFQYASQRQLQQNGEAPARLQVSCKTIGFQGDTPTKYVENYYDRWNVTNAWVTLTRGDSRDRYYLPGASFNMRQSFPGRSSVSRYKEKWDAQGQEIELKFEEDCDVEGISRITYTYRTEELANGERFVYPNEVRYYRRTEEGETLFRRVEAIWDGLVLRKRVSDENEYYEIYIFCQSRNEATALRIEEYITNNQFEHQYDSSGNEKCEVTLHEYDQFLRLTQKSVYRDKACTRPCLRKDNLVARMCFGWARDGLRPISVETFDENGQPMPGLSCGGGQVSKIAWQNIDGQVCEQYFMGTNNVLPRILSAPWGYRPSAKVLDFHMIITEDDKTQKRIVDVVYSSQDCSSDYLRIQGIFYGENQDENLYPNGKPAFVECFSQDGTFSTNAVSCYYTYRRGLPICVEYKRGEVQDGQVVLAQSDYYEEEGGIMLPAVSLYEYDSLGRVIQERHLDRLRGIASLPSNMVYEVKCEYEGYALIPKSRVLISKCKRMTTELKVSEEPANSMGHMAISSADNATWTYRKRSRTEEEWRGRIHLLQDAMVK